MKIRNGIIGFIIIGSLFGCYQPPNLFETGRYSLTVDKIADCTVEAISFEENGQLVVEGKMTKRHHPGALLSGGVRGKIVNAAGKLLEEKSGPFTASPHAKRIHPPARFKLVFASIPPPGSRIEISHFLEPLDPSSDSVGIQ